MSDGKKRGGLLGGIMFGGGLVFVILVGLVFGAVPGLLGLRLVDWPGRHRHHANPDEERIGGFSTCHTHEQGFRLSDAVLFRVAARLPLQCIDTL